ncbi:MAG: translation initiation factor [Bacteroides sp.]|nr:translation initiation factor [Bacteroides sp.]MCM1531187.1 translation initiation factor [Ruminococcus flavefaciens]MCM1555191.1 translation initiation factor [Bacteroides sp.]
MGKKTPIGVVYSTDPNFQYRYEETEEAETLEPARQDLRVMRDSKRRAGKTVTLVTGFVGTTGDLEKLGKTLKTRCGIGGTAKDGEIVLQGDVRDKVCEILTKEGYRFKRAGG